jgi:hypothetical protein
MIWTGIELRRDPRGETRQRRSVILVVTRLTRRLAAIHLRSLDVNKLPSAYIGTCIALAHHAGNPPRT